MNTLQDKKYIYFHYMLKKYFADKKRLAAVTIHALLLVIATILMQYFPLTRPDEKDFLKWAALWRHDLLGSDKKPLLDSVVFIDVSYDLSLIPDTTVKTDSVAPFRGPVQAITDRAKLGYIFQMLGKHPGEYKYVICDLSFEDPAPGDSTFKSGLEKMHPFITTAETNDAGKLIKPVFKVDYGGVNYTPLKQSTFYKMPVFYDGGLKSLPVKVYENVSGNKFTTWHGLTLLDGRLSFNYVLPELYYRQQDLVRSDAVKKANTYYLDDLLPLGEDGFSLLKGKYIIIGNFSDDLHTTYMGKLPGCVILWNVLLTLLNHEQTISIGWLLLLFIIYWLTSFTMFFDTSAHKTKVKEKIRDIRLPYLQKMAAKYISYLGLLIVINLLALLFFGTFISLFYMATYLTLVDVVIEKYAVWMARIKRFFKREPR